VAIFQICPDSPIFKLPAFSDPDVQKWMKICFPQELSHLHAQIEQPAAFEKVQNDAMNINFQNLYSKIKAMHGDILEAKACLDRRTELLSPSKRYPAASTSSSEY
jgi:hypothetical protein